MRTTAARRRAALLAVPALVTALAACGGSGEEPGDAASSSGATGSEPPADPEGPDGAVDATASAYLPVGTGVELTEPGTTLRFGDPAVIAWQPKQDRTATLRVSVDRVDRTSFEESFEGWVITDEMEGRTPVFVRLSVTNADERDLGGETPPLAVIDGDGVRVQPTVATEKEFEPCPGGPLPKRFAPGARADLCLLYLLAPGASFDAVGFLPIDGDANLAGDAITWEGRLTRIDDGKRERGADGNGNGGGQGR